LVVSDEVGLVLGFGRVDEAGADGFHVGHGLVEFV
jgi:hypothetical protein